MTRQPSPTHETPTSWVGYKDLARRQYERGNYEDALTSYTSALNPEFRCPASEQQIILSNLVACRLKLGGPAQARAAIENSKQCIALNPNWAKGHVRLASAYIALGGHSNDACNELQRALSLDPGNTTAREMLLRELRRDHSASSSRANNTNNQDTNGSAANNNGRHSGDTTYGSTNNTYSDVDHDQPPQQYNNDGNNNTQQFAVDDSLTWSDRLQFHVGRATAWYQSQSDDVKTFFKILVVLLVLYVGFGGRFGLGGDTRTMGNYGSDNVYDQYRRYGTTNTKTQSSSYPYTNRNRNNNDYGGGSSSSHSSASHRRTSHHQQNDYYDDHQYYDARPRGGGGSTSSWSLGGFRPFDGGMQSLLLVGGLAYAGHRMGMNPFHTMMIVNALGGGRRRFGRRGGFGMGGGFGGMGMGRGMGGMGYRRRRY